MSRLADNPDGAHKRHKTLGPALTRRQQLADGHPPYMELYDSHTLSKAATTGYSASGHWKVDCTLHTNIMMEK